MKYNFYSVRVIGAMIVSFCALSPLARAVEVPWNSETVQQFDKEIAKNKAEIRKTLAAIKTQQDKVLKDTAQYGQASNQVRDDVDKLKNLRKELAGQKADLYKNTVERKVEIGEAIEGEAESAC
jgi:septal ring factor EnvC (AmiA/AmiB activator)